MTAATIEPTNCNDCKGTGVLTSRGAPSRTCHCAQPKAPAKKPKAKSRAARWEEAASRAVEALTELEDIRQEFEQWRDNLPENLQSSALGEKLDAVADLDVQGALDTAEEAMAADLPQGFGRD